MPEKTFKIRSYGFGELAKEFFPNLSKKSATVYLNRLIREDAELNQMMKEAHYKKGKKVLTPIMVSALIKFMGEPY